MPTFDDVRRLALALPQTSEKTSWGNQMFYVAKKGFVWDRPLNKSDVKALTELGREIPVGEIIGLRVPDENTKHELIASEPETFFTIPHFDGYPAVLARLDAIDLDELGEMITDAWLDRAPKRLAKEFLAGEGDG